MTLFYVPLIILLNLICINSSVAIQSIRKNLFMNGPCMENQFRCLNNQCVSASAFCNGHKDCRDRSDEEYCGSTWDCPRNQNYLVCNWKCVPYFFKCDGKRDCASGEDESYCESFTFDTVRYVDVFRAKNKALNWLQKKRNSYHPLDKWGPELPKTTVAFYLAQKSEDKVVDNEIPYEIALNFVKTMLWKKLSDIPTYELASYINAFLVSCIDPRQFHFNLVEELQRRVDERNASDPFTLLTLCLSGNILLEKDTKTLYDTFWIAEKNNHISTQALVILALTCASDQIISSFPKDDIYNLTSTLKLRQDSSGKIDNLKTTALVMQAIFATDAEPDVLHFNELKVFQYILGEQSRDGSFEDISTAYYVLPVLSYTSLLNISSSHCNSSVKLENECYSYFKNYTERKWKITYSIWIKDNKELQNSVSIQVPHNSTFYSIMQCVSTYYNSYTFKFKMWNGKPYIYKISNLMEDAEQQLYWSIFLLSNGEHTTYEKIYKSPVDVIPKDGDHFIYWYKKDEPTDKFGVLYEKHQEKSL